MSNANRRASHRFIMKVPLRLRSVKAPPLAECAVQSMNISTRGVYFATDLPLREGQLIQVLFRMPEEISESGGNERRFTCRVAHVQPHGFANGMSGVGVQFLYYELM